MDRLPLEILLKIFSEHIAEHYQLSPLEHIDADEEFVSGVSTVGLVGHVNANGKAALALTHVCSLWRGLAMKSRNFWTVVDLDTVRPEWFLEMLDRSRDAPLSFVSQLHLRRRNPSRAHVWSLAHSQFNRCRRIHVHVTIDPDDARAIGALLAMDAPRLEECAIHYIPHANKRFAASIGQKFEAGNAMLFDSKAPLLRSLILVDCHLPPYQYFPPKLSHFYTFIASSEDQTDYSQRRGLPEFILTIPPFSPVETITLVEAIDHSFHPKFDQIPEIDEIALPRLREVQFVGSAYAASHLLRVFRPPAHCSFFLNVDARQWDGQSPEDFMSSMAHLLSPISSEIDAHSWTLGLDAQGTFSLRVTGSARIYDLSFSTTLWGDGPGLEALHDDNLWTLHPRRITMPPSKSPADIAYSSIMRTLSSRFRPALQSAGILELDIPESDFAFSQTVHILEAMSSITQLIIRHCTTHSLRSLEAALTPASEKVLLPQLRRLFLPSEFLENAGKLNATGAFARVRPPQYGAVSSDHKVTGAWIADLEVSFLRR